MAGSADATEVAVVGAGPAGSAAAIELAAAGTAVTLIDKASFPRDKCCGDGLTTGALRRLESLGVDVEQIPSFTVLDELVLRSPSGRIARVPFRSASGIAAATATRHDLDAALVERAAGSGATLRLGSAVSGIERTADGVELLFEDSSRIVARQVIAADGAWSTLRRALGVSATSGSRIGTNWTAFRAYVDGVGEAASRALHVLFTEQTSPGYIWSFPLRGDAANIGVYLEHDEGARGRGLRAAWEQARQDPFLLSILGPGARLRGTARAWPIPTALDTPTGALGGRVLFCGDALGAADPFTGEGIAQALESGSLAAIAIRDSSGGEEAANAYEAALREGLYADHRISTFLSGAFAHPLLTRLCVAGTGAHRAVATQVGRWLYEDYPRSAIWPPTSWHRALRSDALPFVGVRSKLSP